MAQTTSAASNTGPNTGLRKMSFGMPTPDEIVSGAAKELSARPKLPQNLDALTAQDADDDIELPTEPMTINMGPSHPATHGTVRIVLTIEKDNKRQNIKKT